MSAHTAWNVYLNGRIIDTVFWIPDAMVNEVYRGLVNHNGYDARVIVRRRREKK